MKFQLTELKKGGIDDKSSKIDDKSNADLLFHRHPRKEAFRMRKASFLLRLLGKKERFNFHEKLLYKFVV